MRKSRLSIILSTAAIALSVFLFTAACHKATSSLSNVDDNGGYASDNSKMEQNSNDVVAMADVAQATNSGSTLRTTETTATTLGGCATVTNDTISVPHVLTINFGTADCTCADGKNRRGEIIVTYTGRYKDSGSVHTITYSNYFVNDNQLSGKKTVTNMGTNSSGQVYYTVVVNDTLNLGAGNGQIVWAGNRTRTWLSGYSTTTRTDDSYLISGTTSLTRANGNTFTMNITTPLQVAYGCEWIEAGVMTVTGPGGGTRTLNYGSGNCDNEAQLTIGTHTYNITLR